MTNSEIPTISKFNYLNTPNLKQSIYEYHTDGKFEYQQKVGDGVKGQSIAVLSDIIKVLQNFHKKLYVSEKIKIGNKDEQFNRDFDKKITESKKFNLECHVNGTLRSRKGK